MTVDDLLINLRNALKAEAAQTKGKDVTKALVYNLGLVIKDGEIISYAIDRVDETQ